MRRLLNPFSGRQSGIRPFLDNGWLAVTSELEDRFPSTFGDFIEVTPEAVLDAAGGPIDFVWASVPCTTFSIGSMRHHWNATGTTADGREVYRAPGEAWRDMRTDDIVAATPVELTYTPASETARKHRDLLRHTLDVIEALAPSYWVIENPRALMRKMPELAGVERRTVTHCQYGDPRRMKPTDLFGVFPESFEARSCRNGDTCHEAAPRGAKTGTQGLRNAEERSLVPYALPDELRQAIEREL